MIKIHPFVVSPIRFAGLFLALLTPALAAPLTNADVVKLLDAGMPEDVIVQTIQKEGGRFDTAPDSLIQLKAKGATPAELKAMLAAGSGTDQALASKHVTGASIVSEQPLLCDGQTETPLSFIVPQHRTAVRALGFGGAAAYAVLPGPRAERRTKNRQPSFLVSIPQAQQPASCVAVISFAVRSNDTREVLIGGGVVSFSSGIHPDRLRALTFTPLADQKDAKEGFIIYKAVLKAPLEPGEFGLGMEGVHAGVYDFGVD